MPTLWNDTLKIDRYLHNDMKTGDALVFEARLLLQPDLQEKLLWQQKTYTLVQNYGRQQLKQEIEVAHHQLFNQPKHRRFAEKIKALFNL